MTDYGCAAFSKGGGGGVAVGAFKHTQAPRTHTHTPISKVYLRGDF